LYEGIQPSAILADIRPGDIDDMPNIKKGRTGSRRAALPRSSP
jgi:hypothetical protein